MKDFHSGTEGLICQKNCEGWMVGVWEGLNLGSIPNDHMPSQKDPKISIERRCSTILPNVISSKVCDGVDDCPMGEDENSKDWFSSEEVVTGSFSKEVVHQELRRWGEHYFKSNNGSGAIEEKMSSFCVVTDTKIFLLYTILLCTVVALVILVPAACLVS